MVGGGSHLRGEVRRQGIRDTAQERQGDKANEGEQGSGTQTNDKGAGDAGQQPPGGTGDKGNPKSADPPKEGAGGKPEGEGSKGTATKEPEPLAESYSLGTGRVSYREGTKPLDPKSNDIQDAEKWTFEW